MISATAVPRENPRKAAYSPCCIGFRIPQWHHVNSVARCLQWLIRVDCHLQAFPRRWIVRLRPVTLVGRRLDGCAEVSGDDPSDWFGEGIPGGADGGVPEQWVGRVRFDVDMHIPDSGEIGVRAAENTPGRRPYRRSLTRGRGCYRRFA